MSVGAAKAARVIRGVVKWYDAATGRGFIRRDDGPDVEAPASSIAVPGPAELVEGQTVEFEVLPARGGFLAREVRVIAPSPESPTARDA